MNPEEILTAIVSAVSSDNSDRDSIVTKLIKAGLNSEIAEQAYDFIQIAWGRRFLDGLGITFSDLYCCYDANGSLVESGKLKDNLYYKRAYLAADDYKSSSAFRFFALTSAELNAVNNALNNGSNPRNLVTALACIFLAPPTAEGIEAIQNLATKKPKRENSPQASSKAWWRFWE